MCHLLSSSDHDKQASPPSRINLNLKGVCVIRNRFLALAVMMFLPFQVHAFSESVKQHVQTIQAKVNLKGSAFGVREAKEIWDKMEEDVLVALKKTNKEEVLNKEFAKVDFTVIERKGTEIDPIELGNVEAKFHDLGGGAVLVVLNHDNGMRPWNTFRVYEKKGDGYEKSLALDDVSGPWSQDKLANGIIQIQKQGGGLNGKFSSFHLLAGSHSNRSQIAWNKGKPAYWYPEVDYFMKGDKKVSGRGPGEAIQ